MTRQHRRVCLLLLAGVLAGCASSPRYDRIEEDDAPTKAAKTNMQLAVGYLEKGDTETALEKIQRALSHDRNSAQAHTVAAIINERIGREAIAEDHYRHALRLSPNDGDTLNNYGQFLCKINRVDESIKYFDRAIEQPFYKTPEVAHTNAGICLERSGTPEKAEQRFREALSLRNDYPDALFLMARSLCSRGDDFRARAFLQRLQGSAGDSAESLWLCVVIEERLGDKKSASDCAQSLKTKYPDSNQAKRLLEGNNNDASCG